MSVFLLTTNMRLFLNPIINIIFSPILICEKPFLFGNDHTFVDTSPALDGE